jgi:hypothetical protein
VRAHDEVQQSPPLPEICCGIPFDTTLFALNWEKRSTCRALLMLDEIVQGAYHSSLFV